MYGSTAQWRLEDSVTSGKDKPVACLVDMPLKIMGTHTISNTATLHGWLESVGLDDFLANPGCSHLGFSQNLVASGRYI